MATFEFTPDFGSQANYKPRVRMAQFGDGYQQRVADGINTSPATWPLAFTNRDDTERDGILSFLVARNGVESFDWTPPFGGASIKVTCAEWDWTPARFNVNTITATFMQVFEP